MYMARCCMWAEDMSCYRRREGRQNIKPLKRPRKLIYVPWPFFVAGRKLLDIEASFEENLPEY